MDDTRPCIRKTTSYASKNMRGLGEQISDTMNSLARVVESGKLLEKPSIETPQYVAGSQKARAGYERESSPARAHEWSINNRAFKLRAIGYKLKRVMDTLAHIQELKVRTRHQVSILPKHGQTQRRQSMVASKAHSPPVHTLISRRKSFSNVRSYQNRSDALTSFEHTQANNRKTPVESFIPSNQVIIPVKDATSTSEVSGGATMTQCSEDAVGSNSSISISQLDDLDDEFNSSIHSVHSLVEESVLYTLEAGLCDQNGRSPVIESPAASTLPHYSQDESRVWSPDASTSVTSRPGVSVYLTSTESVDDRDATSGVQLNSANTQAYAQSPTSRDEAHSASSQLETVLEPHSQLDTELEADAQMLYSDCSFPHAMDHSQLDEELPETTAVLGQDEFSPHLYSPSPFTRLRTNTAGS